MIFAVELFNVLQLKSGHTCILISDIYYVYIRIYSDSNLVYYELRGFFFFLIRIKIMRIK